MTTTRPSTPTRCRSTALAARAASLGQTTTDQTIVGMAGASAGGSINSGGLNANSDGGGAGRRGARGKHAPDDSNAKGCGGGEAAHRFAAWTGGYVNYGRLSTGVNTGIDYVSTGLSAGVDYWFSPAFAGGFGVGYGNDKSTIGVNGTVSKAFSYNAAIYGSWHPSRHTFLDAVIGYGVMNFDSNRFITGSGGEFASGSRSGHQIFGSVTSGYEYRDGNLLASPYARVNASWSTLDAFTESGGGVFALQYGTQTVNSFTGGFGLRAAYQLNEAWGAITPRMRIEYAHEFAGASTRDHRLCGPCRCRWFDLCAADHPDRKRLCHDRAWGRFQFHRQLDPEPRLSHRVRSGKNTAPDAADEADDEVLDTPIRIPGCDIANARH